MNTKRYHLLFLDTVIAGFDSIYELRQGAKRFSGIAAPSNKDIREQGLSLIDSEPGHDWTCGI